MAETQNLREIYETDADFRGYVDRYCKNYNEGKSISVEEALEHEIVRLYAERGEVNESTTNTV